MQRRRALPLLLALAVTLFGAMPASAEVAQMSIKIDGLACPFCVYGIEKKLRGVDSISDVSIDLETGTANLALVAGKTPTLSEVRSAVEKAGFTSREVSATVIGTPSVEKHSVRLHVRDAEQTYFLFEQGASADRALSEDAQAKLISLADRGALVAVSGVLHEHAEGLPSLSVDTVEELQTLTLGVEGMRCGNCASRLDTLLEDTDGVYRAVVDLDGESVTVESLGRAVDAKTLRAVIEEAGFSASDVSTQTAE